MRKEKTRRELPRRDADTYSCGFPPTKFIDADASPIQIKESQPTGKRNQ
jgi:hypothetical protein